MRPLSLLTVLIGLGGGYGLFFAMPVYSYDLKASNTEVAPPGIVDAVPTFESLGLSWTPQTTTKINDCQVTYRRQNSTTWKRGLPLWYDERNGECRGSLVHLEPDTMYQIQVSVEETHETARALAKTWSEHFPVAKTIYLPEESHETLTINESGSPKGYVLYTAQPNKAATIDANGEAENNIVVNASYIIIRGLRLLNARQNGIRLGTGSHDIVIEGNDVSGWGRIDFDGWGVNLDAAIYSDRSEKLPPERIIIQRNRLHHPRSDANAWDEYRIHMQSNHPRGPQAISLWNSLGNHVIRYNDIYSDDDHKFNDCIGGGANFSNQGFPNQNSDIYGNRISDCWDDAIESEGANKNVRIWSNYIDTSYVMIAAAATHVGPLYIWRNVSDRSRRTAKTDMSDAKRGYFFKTQSTYNKYNGQYFGDGRIYVFHNTILQRPAENYGVSSGITDFGGRMTGVTSRNNILQVNSSYRASIKNSEAHVSNDFDYDLYNGRIVSTGNDEQHGIFGVPKYNSDNRSEEFALDPKSPGVDAGVRIPNFNDRYTGRGPDIGAFELNSSPLDFGTDVYNANE